MRGAERAAPAALLALITAFGLSACATVEPWERGHLAQPQMALEPHPAQRTLREHSYRSREAGGASEAGGGGGCGCY